MVKLYELLLPLGNEALLFTKEFLSMHMMKNFTAFESGWSNEMLAKRSDIFFRALLTTVPSASAMCKLQDVSQSRRRYDFSHTVLVDSFYVDKRSIFETVVIFTSYQAAHWFPTVSADFIWPILCIGRMNVYKSSLAIIMHDSENRFTAKVF